MVKKPEVSVIIPTYNRAHLVGRAIQSVLNQTFQDFELIVVDDASSDDTKKVVRGFHDSRIRYLRHERNKGASGARNTGIKFSTGEYIAFLDSDDEWLPEKLERQLNVFRDAPTSLGVVSTGMVAVNKDNKAVPYYLKYRGNIFDLLLTGNCIGNTSVTLIKKECFEKVGFFDEDLSIQGCEDWDMWIRLAQFYEFDFVPEMLVKYHSHNASISSNPRSYMECHMTISNKFQKKIKSSSKKIQGRHYFHVGRILWWTGDIKTGARFFINSLSASPLTIKDLLFFLFLYLGSKILNIFKRIKRALIAK